MKETKQLRNLMEALNPIETVKEDWGSSDWYGLIKYMDEYIDKHGLSPEVIKDAAREAALTWGNMMGHDMSTRDGEEDAIEDARQGWIRISKRGQMLQKMFAPVEPKKEPEKDYDPADHGIERLGFVKEDTEGMYDIFIDENSVTISNAGSDVLSLSHKDWQGLIDNYNQMVRSK